MNIGVIKEEAVGECRVSLIPNGVARLVAVGHRVFVQRSAGSGSGFSDESYREQGATIVDDLPQLYQESQAILAVRPPDTLEHIRPGTIMIGMFQAWSQSPARLQELGKHQVLAFSLDAMPRISRAQNMDVLSSMSTVAGYRAVILAAERLGRFFPMLMTAAGTIIPAKVLVLGAGVAGLQAIATAHRLGAVVKAFDTRVAAKEQVESLGASFLNLGLAEAGTADGYAQGLDQDQHERELEFLCPFVNEADVVITTAQIPGRRAPILINAEMVSGMKPGSVIVDLAGESGGNCELSKPGPHFVTAHGVQIMAPLDLVSQMAPDASFLYSRNMVNFVLYLETLGFEKLGNDDIGDEIYQRTRLAVPAHYPDAVAGLP